MVLFLCSNVRNVRRNDDWGKNGGGLVIFEVAFEASCKDGRIVVRHVG